MRSHFQKCVPTPSCACPVSKQSQPLLFPHIIGDQIWKLDLCHNRNETFQPREIYHFPWYPPKKLKYGKPRLGESTLTQIVLDTPHPAQIDLFVLGTFRGVTSEQITLYKDMKRCSGKGRMCSRKGQQQINDQRMSLIALPGPCLLLAHDTVNSICVRIAPKLLWK